MYLPGIVSDRSWRQGRIPILYALTVWSAKQPANWPGTSASISYAVYNACLAMRLRYRIAWSATFMRRTIRGVEQLLRWHKIWNTPRRDGVRREQGVVGDEGVSTVNVWWGPGR